MEISGTRHLRILTRLRAGDLVWEVVGETYCTQYDESTGKQIRIARDVVDAMERSGWLCSVRQAPAAHKLDSWDITESGRGLLEHLQLKRKVRVSPRGRDLAILANT